MTWWSGAMPWPPKKTWKSLKTNSAASSDLATCSSAFSGACVAGLPSAPSLPIPAVRLHTYTCRVVRMSSASPATAASSSTTRPSSQVWMYRNGKRARQRSAIVRRNPDAAGAPSTRACSASVVNDPPQTKRWRRRRGVSDGDDVDQPMSDMGLQSEYVDELFDTREAAPGLALGDRALCENDADAWQ